MDITRTLPTPDSVLQFEPEELAAYLLDHLGRNKNDLHLNNLMGGGLMQHYGNDPRVSQALMEAWAWLVRELCFLNGS